MSQQPWASDVAVSMPEPRDPSPLGQVPMFGFVFTENGLFHDLTTAEHERLSIPTFAPIEPVETVWGDADVEGR